VTAHVHDLFTDHATHSQCVRVGWRCDRCRRDHEANPPRCTWCDYTVLAPTWATPVAAEEPNRG
jgi:hypothetical protein